MKNRDLEKISDTDLIKEFARIANRLGEAVINWESGANETKELFALRNVLRSRGKQAMLKLAPLLEDKNRFVQYYAARQLHTLIPKRSRQIIEENAKQGDAIAGDAGMHLLALDRNIRS
jgi:hypothetical protein